MASLEITGFPTGCERRWLLHASEAVAAFPLTAVVVQAVGPSEAAMALASAAVKATKALTSVAVEGSSLASGAVA